MQHTIKFKILYFLLCLPFLAASQRSVNTNKAEEVIFESQLIAEQCGLTTATTKTDTLIPPPPPPPPPPQKEPNDIFRIAEQMPIFKFDKCEGMESYRDRKACSDSLMIRHIYENMEYPKTDAEGIVVVGMVITETGKKENIEIRRSRHPLLDKEALRLVQSLPDCEPGKQRGREVKVQYYVPIKFSLQAE